MPFTRPRLITAALAYALAGAGLLACRSPTGDTTGGTGGRLAISLTGIVLPAGDTARLALTLERGSVIYMLPATPSNSWPAGLDVTWSTSDSVIAIVDREGRLTARALGRAVVRAMVGDARDSATVTVRTADPIPVLRARALALGTGHTCALAGAGMALCWGLNYAGSLGGGAPRRFQVTASATPVAGGLTFTTLSAGGDDSCGLTAAGQAYCWGRNEDGEVGDGTAHMRAQPTPVAGGQRYSRLSVGFRHACAVTAAGEVDCWGRNDSGQIGVPGAPVAVRVPTRVPLPEPVVMVTAGGGHTCARTGAGRAYCWGANDFGQLGRGAPSGPAAPGLVTGGLAFTSVTTGDIHTCGVTPDGAAYCWGNNFSGRLGTGDTQARSEPAPVAGGLVFGAVDAGGEHTCGLTTGGEAYCWGSNFRGQLGDGLDLGGPLRLDQRDRSVPTRVATTRRFAQLAAGDEAHTCALTTSGEAHCWGLNGAGQLGIGYLPFAPGTQLPAHSSPVPVVDSP